MLVTEGNFAIWLLADLIALVGGLDWLTERIWRRYVDAQLVELNRVIEERKTGRYRRPYAAQFHTVGPWPLTRGALMGR